MPSLPAVRSGYDHKKMGITARGAWESVKRQFREMGKDIQARDDFTVVGIGDMSGDVFGNGMLLSRHIKLLAAFNHLHVFIDPFRSRNQLPRSGKRLFALPRSGWDDYDKSLLSPGGAVFSVPPVHPAQSGSARGARHPGRAADPQRTDPPPAESAGGSPMERGIGTYVKARRENDSEVGDRANDAVRINGGELRCKVVGEGGNLGLTQLGGSNSPAVGAGCSPTPSTTPAASTVRTTRSTSKSC